MKTFKEFLHVEQFAGESPGDITYIPGKDPAKDQIERMRTDAQLASLKMLDPSGVLSWPDVPPAVNAYKQNPNLTNAIFMILALTAVIPIAGKFTKPLKMAVRAGKIAEVEKLIAPAVQEIAKHPEILTKANVSKEAVMQASNIVAKTHLNKVVPAAHNQTTSKMFDYNKWIAAGGTVGRSNKPTKDGIKQILTYLQIPFKDEQLNSQSIKQIFTNVQNKQKLQNFLNNNPIEVKYFPDSYAEIKDGNHRFELAILAGITNFLTK